MEKVYARFLKHVTKPESGKTKITVGGYVLQYADFDEETTKQLKKEMSKYELCVDNDYCYEYDEDDYPTKGSSRKLIPIEKLISLSSSVYSSDEPRADCLIVGGNFVGVVVYVKQTGGNGWSNYDQSWYTILYTDGRIVGENKGHYSYSGASSSKEDEYTYTLREVKNL